ncbi:MAG TPA: ABC transporter permease [Alphaproteobacteria bacterium]|nr:ABC transporter permease [Alphaproteobacteria bacterium]
MSGREDAPSSRGRVGQPKGWGETTAGILLRRREPVLALLILCLLGVVGLRAPIFLTPGSIDAVLTDTSILAMLALGQMMVILTRGIDLSVASNLALTGMAVALLSRVHPELPTVFVLALAVLIGLALGAVNGVLVAVVRLPPIVVTLGTLSVYRGTIFVLSDGAWISSHEMTEAFRAFPLERFAGLTHLLWLAVLAVAAAAFFLNRTRWGRELYAVGGNPVAARYVGVPVERREFLVYCLSGAIAGLCGYLWVARYAIAYTEIAYGFELTVIAACVIGGVSIAGGIGTVTGTVLGALFLGVINNALPVIDVSPFWQTAIAGAVILAAVVVNSRSEAQKGKRILRNAQVAGGAGS